MLVRELLEDQRKRRPGSLATFGFSAYSQQDEDGIIHEIFRRVGTTTKRFVEFGCGDGLTNETVYLLMSGWTGVWIDGSEKNIQRVRQCHAPAIEEGRLKAECSFITAENIDQLLSELCGSDPVDFISIDIDGNDYWVWQALQSIQPRVVSIEYNATIRPPVVAVQEYHPDAVWDGSNFGSASLKALELLGTQKGYSLVGCNLAGQTACFVRNDCLGDHFPEPHTAEHHYMPPNYDLFPLIQGHAHPPGAGKYVQPIPDSHMYRP